MDEVLKFAIENGMIDLSYIQDEIAMKKREELLKRHKWAISQGKDGYWRTYLPDANKPKGRRQIKRITKEDIENVVCDYLKEDIENPTINEVFEEWNDRRLELKKIAPGTHQRNKQIYERHFFEFGKRKIKSVAPEDISDFLEAQVPIQNLTSKAFSGLKTITKGFLKRAKKRKLISFNVEEIFNDLDISDTSLKKTYKKDKDEIFTEEETGMILEYLTQNPDIRNLGILLIFLTGLRVGELVALKFEDIEGNIIHVNKTETRYKKNGKDVYEIKYSPKTDAGDRSAIVPESYSWVLTRLKLINPFAEYVFSEHGKRFTTNVIRRRLVRICNKLDIPPRSPHKIRKTYASIMFENHVDSRMLIKIMGHTDIMCTETHYHRNRRNSEQMFEIINQIPDFKSKVI